MKKLQKNYKKALKITKISTKQQKVKKNLKKTNEKTKKMKIFLTILLERYNKNNENIIKREISDKSGTACRLTNALNTSIFLQGWNLVEAADASSVTTLGFLGQGFTLFRKEATFIHVCR